MGILTDLATRLASKATTSFRGGAYSRLARAYASLTSKCPYPNRWDGRAAVTELSKYFQTGKFDQAEVDALSQVVT